VHNRGGRRFVKSLQELNRELASFTLRDPLLEIKTSPTGVQVSGYASTFGAFSATIEQHRRAGSSPAMLFGHDQNKLIGIWTARRPGLARSRVQSL
jgi:hypothetical protein